MAIRPALTVLILATLLAIQPIPALSETIHCSQTPAHGTLNLTIEPVWEQPAEDTDFLLATLTDAAIDAAGNICVVDFRQKQLQVFDPQGNWLHAIGREGEGPGEFRDARKLFLEDGRYGVLQAFPAAIVWLNADGTPSEKVSIGVHDPANKTFVSVAHAVQDESGIYGWVSRTKYIDNESETHTWIAKLNPDGSTGPTIYEPPDRPSARVDDGIDEGKVYDIWLGRWTSDGEGGVWVAPERDRFVLQHWNAAGELVLELERDYELVRRNQDGMDGIITWFKGRGWTVDQIHVGEYSPVVRQIRRSDDGNLWVRLGSGGKDPDSDLVRIYDVFSPSGEYLEQRCLHSSLDIGGLCMLDDETGLVLSDDPEVDEQVLSMVRIVP